MKTLINYIIYFLAIWIFAIIAGHIFVFFIHPHHIFNYTKFSFFESLIYGIPLIITAMNVSNFNHGKKESDKKQQSKSFEDSLK